MKLESATNLDLDEDVSDKLSPLTLSEARALVSLLSTTDRMALIECLKNAALQKREGFWHGSPGCKPISGNTIANLSRDGLLAVSKNHRYGSARLTERGKWFAQRCSRAPTR
jgi:hypothetical protein